MKKTFSRILKLFSVLILFFGPKDYAQNWKELADPDEGEVWVQPAQVESAKPVWGFAHGIRVGLAPLSGPRGLLRIYTPYLGHQPYKVMNYLALQPVVRGNMGLSELEESELDDKKGKRFWSANDTLAVVPQPEENPARGIIKKSEGRQTLTLYIFSEDFDNGAEVYVRLRFYKNRPYEVEIKTYTKKDSAPVDNFIVTATMGNFARLRNLYLKDKTVSAGELWPRYKGNDFTPPAYYPVDDFIKNDRGKAFFIAATDEENPEDVRYTEDTPESWKYYGQKATQYWCAQGSIPSLKGVVNGRYTFWANQSPIPGGVAFENFELNAPYKRGRTFVFGISPLPPKKLIKEVKEQ